MTGFTTMSTGPLTIIMLYWLVLVFICDLREVAFPNMPRRASWLCR